MNLQDVYVLFYMREDKQHNGIIQNPTLKTEEQKVRELSTTLSFPNPVTNQKISSLYPLFFLPHKNEIAVSVDLDQNAEPYQVLHCLLSKAFLSR